MVDREPGKVNTQWGWRCRRCGMFVPNLADSPERSIKEFGSPKFPADCDEHIVRSVLEL